MLQKISGNMKKDLFFLYNNVDDPNSTIDREFAYHVGKAINDNKYYDDAFVVLHTKKGKLQYGQKVIELLKEKYATIHYYVPEIVGEAGTLIALSGDDLFLDDMSMIFPCDPSFITKDGIERPTYLMRNYLGEFDIEDDFGRITKFGVDIFDAASYKSAITNYGKILDCSYGFYADSQKRRDIDSFMVLDVNDHEQLITRDDFIDMGFSDINKPIFYDRLTQIHELLKNQIGDQITGPSQKTICGNIILGTKSGYILNSRFDGNDKLEKQYYLKNDSKSILLK